MRPPRAVCCGSSGRNHQEGCVFTQRLVFFAPRPSTWFVTYSAHLRWCCGDGTSIALTRHPSRACVLLVILLMQGTALPLKRDAFAGTSQVSRDHYKDRTVHGHHSHVHDHASTPTSPCSTTHTDTASRNIPHDETHSSAPDQAPCNTLPRDHLSHNNLSDTSIVFIGSQHPDGRGQHRWRHSV